ncbi:peptidoglycan DD-metalloendopeptidase family protein [Polynucleobacter sp. 15G-AUS-farblos]|uniref:peptidoglycan DD-metalloendopeptidase family protein n=1 Tax=Polynucleobacter sp. 15G-AUS-farblos TaxID=2689094 RepID=UPI001C0D7DDA|nr:peptidoglycan DD-metalloendopeptidase family protein [Polynucleobacter sp. 15G-AUS-farblos]MBU3583151.1 peptidoglycan DD-metalloendopeptidase family protein [Polynucleobacter sp. 15G-AUS-farblos]
MSNSLSKASFLVLLCAAMALTVGCTSTRTKPASVTDRSAGSSSSSESTPPGYYRVKKGDTLARIALDNGQAPRDVAQWNTAANPNFNPNLIEVGDLIIVKPPAGARTSKPLEVKAVAPDRADSVKADAPKAPPTKAEVVAEPGIRLSWPAKGKVTEEFNDKNKGIDIAGKVGEAVQAASDGNVVYAGNSLRGYGNLVIIKHDNTYLTAYAHNSKLLVKEGENVRKGQKIAEMGDTDTNSPKLHFELRVNGKPVNPTPYLQ